MLTTKEVAAQMGVPVSTVKNWVQSLPVPWRVDSQGHRRYPEVALELLETVKNLREERHGYESIRRVMITMLPPDEQEAAEVPATAARADEAALLLEAQLHQQELAESFARATQEIGRLQERVSNLRAQKAMAHSRYAKDLEEAHATIAALEAKAAQPWWQKLGWGRG